MGSKNRDRWTPEDWRAAFATVGRMRDGGWRVMSHCVACNLDMWVDLDRIVRERGPAAVLWNRRQACRRIGCAGQVRFIGLPPGMGPRQVHLDADWPKGAPPPLDPPGER